MKEGLFKIQIPDIEKKTDSELICEIEDELLNIENCLERAALNKTYKAKLAQGFNKLRKKMDEEDMEKEALADFLIEVKNFLINESFFSYLSDEQLLKAQAKIGSIAEAIRAGKYEKIGFGESADVFTEEIGSGLCFKVISNLNEYERCNTVREEAELMDDFIKHKIKGVRIPVPYYSYMDIKNNIYILVMEAINNSATVESIVKDNIELPNDFDIDGVFERLHNFFEQMNQAGRFHNDFHDKNIMLNLQQGNADAVVIDFGKASISRPSILLSENVQINKKTVDVKSVDKNRKKLDFNLNNRR